MSGGSDARIISVFGTGRVKPGEPVFALAEQLGRELAEGGFAIANGGYGGTMLAGAKGAAAAGGTVVGVTCSAFTNSVANPYITREVVTGSLNARLDTLVKLGDGYVVLPGGTGTLLELAAVWELKNKKFFDSAKPIVLLGDFWKPLADLVGRDDPRSLDRIVFADDPTRAVALIREALGL